MPRSWLRRRRSETPCPGRGPARFIAIEYGESRRIRKTLARPHYQHRRRAVTPRCISGAASAEGLQLPHHLQLRLLQRVQLRIQEPRLHPPVVEIDIHKPVGAALRE